MEPWDPPGDIWPPQYGNHNYADGQYTSRLNKSGRVSGYLGGDRYAGEIGLVDGASGSWTSSYQAECAHQWYSTRAVDVGGRKYHGRRQCHQSHPGTQRRRRTGRPGYDTGPLYISPSTISAEYLCQVPKRKPIGNLIVTILVADLVLLQTVWQIYKLVVDTFFLKDGSESSASPTTSPTTFFGKLTPRRPSFRRVLSSPEQAGMDEELHPMVPMVRPP